MDLRLPIKAMNDTLGPEGLVPSLLGFGIMRSLPVINNPLAEQKDRMSVLSICREMKTVTAELRISQAIRSKLPPSADIFFPQCDTFRVYEEKEKRWCGSVKVIRVCNTEITVTDDIKTSTYGIREFISSNASTRDWDL